MNKQDIIARITPEIYAIECEDAWKAAPFTGGNDVSRLYISATPLAISQLIWETEHGLDGCQKVTLLFAVYRDLPCYGLLSEVYLHHYRHLEMDAQALYWHEVAALLAQPEEALAQPVCYSLAMDFLDDSELCSHAWNHLVMAHAPDQLVIRILDVSAPVPFEVKEHLYLRLLPIARWHEAIYKSLMASYYTLYGHIDKVRARELLTQLILPPQDAQRLAFQQALAHGERFANYYEDRQMTDRLA